MKKLIKYALSLAVIFLFITCSDQEHTQTEQPLPSNTTQDFPQFISVLGIAQDAGYPQAACKKTCCKQVALEDEKKVSCLGIFDQSFGKYWLLDASPDLGAQMKMASKLVHKNNNIPAGIFLTHAHIGHYTGLMEFGREVIGAKSLDVFAMPKMKNFLENNGPWSQLVKLQNIKINALSADQEVVLKEHLKVTPFLVPHRDEFSETVGYLVHGQKKKVLFIPDIDKWEKWDRDIIEEIEKVDYAFLDGTFFQNGEIWGRDMSKIPHPFIKESMAKFKNLSKKEKAKIYFIHFNHTNPLLQEGAERKQVMRAGYQIAEEGMIIEI